MAMALVRHDAFEKPAMLLVAGILVVLAITLDASAALPLRLPGHRSFPGAFALVTALDVLTPPAALAFAAISGAMVGAMNRTHMTVGASILAWVIPAFVGFLFARPTRARELLVAIAVGVGFGLMYWAMASRGGGMAMAKAASHVMFGLAGAATATGLNRWRHS